MERFFWVVEGGLAGCSRPGGNSRQHTVDALAEDLVWLRTQGIEAVLTLTEGPIDGDVCAQQGMTNLHVPVPDLHPPLPREFAHALDFIDEQRSLGRAVAVHCLMGQGRTGTVLAAYLIRTGLTASEAVCQIRDLCPGAIGTDVQERALRAYEERRDWIL